MITRSVVYLTREGYESLEKELEYLKTVRRQEVADRLHNALSEGELIENAELEEARREQSFLEGRILEISDKLRKAKIIAKDKQGTDHVGLGDLVTVREEGQDATEQYMMVGSEEADPGKGKISNESPLGSAMIGKHVGEKAVVTAPDGDLIFEIVAIE